MEADQLLLSRCSWALAATRAWSSSSMSTITGAVSARWIGMLRSSGERARKRWQRARTKGANASNATLKTTVQPTARSGPRALQMEGQKDPRNGKGDSELGDGKGLGKKRKGGGKGGKGGGGKGKGPNGSDCTGYNPKQGWLRNPQWMQWYADKQNVQAS